MLLPRYTFTNTRTYLKQKPAYIYHHLMKCGGSSVNISLKLWFNLVYDHLTDPKYIDQYINERYDISNINSETCIIGHYAYDGTYLFQRYPELLTDNNLLKTFTFIRDPLAFYISLYYYSRNNGRIKKTLAEFFDKNKNLMSYFIPCNENNYKEILDKYFFIGITERLQESLDKLADILGKRRTTVSHINRSVKDSQLSILTEDFIEEFKEKNKLDYQVYKYCVDKFSNL